MVTPQSDGTEPSRRKTCTEGQRSNHRTDPVLIPLSTSDFTYSFTFFSKFFSSFPHGTSSLSVSRKCLALDGHYHPICAAVPSNTTQRRRFVAPRPSDSGRGYDPLCPVVSTTSCVRHVAEDASVDYNSPAQGTEITTLSCSRFARRY